MATIGVNLTDRQRKALEARGVSVALIAGAGCGKTSVLTARYLGELDGRALREVVAVTFTEKAARELRARVRAACRSRLAAGESPRTWKSILRGLEAAPIDTFHGYCGGLLRAFPAEAGVEPGFAVLEESVASSLRDAALDSCLRRWIAERDEDFLALAIDLGLDGARATIAALIADRCRADLGDWARLDADSILDRWRAHFDAHARPALLSTIRGPVAACLALLAIPICPDARFLQRRDALLGLLPGIAEVADAEGRLAAVVEHARIQGIHKSKFRSESAYESIKSSFEELRDAIRTLRGRLAWDEAASRRAAEQGLRLSRLAAGAIEAYDRVRRAEGALDFDDLLLRSRDLLRAPDEGPRGDIIEAIATVLVDEFQDTDPIQGEILRRIVGDEIGGGRLYLVGDRKQSIYRFRGAQPDIFDDFRAAFPEAGRLALTENFRSRPELIAFFNALFARCFPDPDDRLEPGAEPPPCPGGARHAVEFLWAVGSDEPAPSRPNAGERRRGEARRIARRIATILGDGWPVRDRAEGRWRGANPGDVALLFRTLNDAGPYERALAEEGLDYHVVGGSAFFAQQEVIDVINLLATVEDPVDELALAGTLRGPFCCVSDDALYWLATAGPADLALNFEQWHALPELRGPDREAVARARRLVEGWRALKDRVPMAELLDRALDESGYEVALLGEFLGARKRANVRKLVRLARQFDRRGGFTLADLVARLRADLRDPPREEQAATTDEAGQAVRLMTIHQAKGLEFPIVVLPDLNRKAVGERSRVALHGELGPLVKPLDDTGDDAGASLGWAAYHAIEQAAEEAESLRLFYVAATRARDLLILSAGMGPDEPADSTALKLLDSAFDRASGSCKDGPLPCPVFVTPDEPPVAPRNRSRRRPDLLRIADALDPGPSPALSSTKPTATKVRRPSFLDLDPFSSRVDSLIRAVLADPNALVPGSLTLATDRAGRLQVPSAPARVVGAALHHMISFVSSPLARRIASSNHVVRSLPWILPWPADDPEPTVVRGLLDFAFRDELGSYEVVTLVTAESDARRERLRHFLSMRAAEAFGQLPVVRGWIVDLDPSIPGINGSLRDDAAITSAWTDLLAGRVAGDDGSGIEAPLQAIDQRLDSTE
ncbi:MAG TPA: UvrD-helicase domain-containing protein [Isosphaeraceae bacterium]|nr:UvrD-helicase domain-containing protein [Isosphaeraceae bacterium]